MDSKSATASLRTDSAGASTAAVPEILFAEAPDGWGIHFTPTCGASPRRAILEVNGTGAALLDADGDGDLDVYFSNAGTLEEAAAGGGRAGAYFRNDGGKGNGGGKRFVEATRGSGLGVAGILSGCAVGDVDADGDPDLFVAGFGRDLLFTNDGKGHFTERGREAGVSDDRWGTSAAFLDGDGDGDLDLYAVRYVDFDPSSYPPPGGSCTWKGYDVMCGPEGMTPTPDVWYVNDGRGTFRDRSLASGFGSVTPSFGLGITTLDAEGDNLIDVYVANDSMPNFLFHNLGGGRFEEVGLASNTALSMEGREQAGMGTDAGDWDGDGRMDLVVTNFSAEADGLYHNEGQGFFWESSLATGLGHATLAALGWGTGFLDADNDGDLDLLAIHGHVYEQADLPGTDTSYRQAGFLFLHDGDRMREVAAARAPALARLRPGRAAAFGDLDGDGDTDAVIVNLGEPVEVLENRTGSRAGWLRVVLVATRSNPGAIGARVTIEAGGHTQVREVRGASSFQAANDPRPLIGLGDAAVVDRLEVLWPSGSRTVLRNLPARTSVRVVEGG